MPYMHCLICSPQVWGRCIINLIRYLEMLRNQLKFTYMGTAIIQSQVCLMPDFQFCLPNHASVNPSMCKYYFHRAWTQLNMVSSNSFRDTEFSLTQLYLDRPNSYNVIMLQTRGLIQNSICLPTVLKRQLNSGAARGNETQRVVTLLLLTSLI